MFSSSPEQIINQFNKSYFLIPFTKENAKAGKSYNVIDNIYAKKIDGDDNNNIVVMKQIVLPIKKIITIITTCANLPL